MNEDIRALVPRHKSDWEHVQAIIAKGYPAVEPVLAELLQWLQDYNWPVALGLAPFLASIGTPLTPYVRQILNTDDEMWQYWILTLIIAKSPEIAKAVQDQLIRLATNPTVDEKAAELDTIAQDILRMLTTNSNS